MPTYSYSTKDGSATIERFYRIGEQPRRIRVDGKTYYRDLSADHSGPRPVANPGWPIESMALSVHPDQVPAETERLRKLGVPTEIRADGTVLVRSNKHQRELARACGMHNRNSYV